MGLARLGLGVNSAPTASVGGVRAAVVFGFVDARDVAAVGLAAVVLAAVVLAAVGLAAADLAAADLAAAGLAAAGLAAVGLGEVDLAAVELIVTSGLCTALSLAAGFRLGAVVDLTGSVVVTGSVGLVAAFG